MAKAKKDPDVDDKPKKETGPLTLAPEVETAMRKIAKEEIGKALGHTIV